MHEIRVVEIIPVKFEKIFVAAVLIEMGCNCPTKVRLITPDSEKVYITNGDCARDLALER